MIATVQRRKITLNSKEPAASDDVAVEEPLEIRLNGTPLSVTMRSPGDDLDLVRGFLLTEQIIRAADDLTNLVQTGENIVEASVPAKILEGKDLKRNFYATSSCGVCGKASIDQLKIERKTIESAFQIRAADLLGVPSKMRDRQKTFDKTGGLHAAALFDSAGEIICLKEDVGRHNAVDKVIGWAAARGFLPASDFGLFVSGRTSFEILQKATAARIPFVAAVSAPSSLAVSSAKEFGVTLAGFVRGESFNLYHGESRIIVND